MGNEKPGVRYWVAAVAVAAIVVTVWVSRSFTATLMDALALGLLSLCAALAHLFPIRSASDGASYRLTNVFVIAGAIILPTDLLTPLAALAVLPDVWQRRHRGLGRVLLGWVFNLSQTSLAAHAAGAWASGIGAQDFGPLGAIRDLVGA